MKKKEERTQIQLKNLILICAAFAFATLIIQSTRKFEIYWYLYSIPTFIAAFTYNVPGALVVGLSSLSFIGWRVYVDILQKSITENAMNTIYQIIIGSSIFFISGILFGLLSGKQKRQQSILEHLSINDRLTTLYNYSYFVDRLQEEVKRADRYHTSLSLIMIDIDHFKEFNDTFGHFKGNLLLSKLAKSIKQQVREIDTVARYGGEEFAALLPNAGDEAIRVAERIRKAVEEMEFEGDALQPKAKKTISVGVAIYPNDADDDTGFIVKADEALYWAKASGRNKVCVYSRDKDIFEKMQLS
jgi:diguanylate cyclase (GGDEF)-like protein